jgi:hypothetical protein
MRPGMVQIARRWCQPTPRPIGRATCCVEIDKPPDCPDLAIYSQDEQFAAGNPPTWDNPDIVTNTITLDVKVTVRNLSTDTSAVNGLVEFSTSFFGIGVKRTVESLRRISLPPKGEVTLPFMASAYGGAFPDGVIRPPAHIRLEHPYDSRVINNVGSSMVTEARTTQPAVGRKPLFIFPVVNQLPETRTIALSLLPNELNAVVTPTSRSFAPLESFAATLQLQVPDIFHGTSKAPIRKDVTVVGRGPDGGVIDGLTYIIWIDD